MSNKVWAISSMGIIQGELNDNNGVLLSIETSIGPVGVSRDNVFPNQRAALARYREELEDRRMVLSYKIRKINELIGIACD